MKHDYVILTDHLRLRQVQFDDIFQIMEWRNNAETRKWFLNSKTISPEGQALWYEKYLRADKEIMFVIEEKDNAHRILGTVALTNINEDDHSAEVGRFMIGNLRVRGKGIGLEGITAACEFCFNTYDVNRIYCRVYEDNQSCLKTIFNMGFITVGSELDINNRTVLICEFYRP